jgi:hypothetical protein
MDTLTCEQLLRANVAAVLERMSKIVEKQPHIDQKYLLLIGM